MPSGESQYLGEVRQTGSIQVPEASIHYQIRTFITNYRTVSTDYQIVYSNIDDCFFMTTQSFTPIFRQNLLDDSPFALVGKIRRTVEIESILLITGRSYNVNWTESSYDTSANHSTVKMRAVVTIRLVTPTDITIKRNPLGIYIENLEMTELWKKLSFFYSAFPFCPAWQSTWKNLLTIPAQIFLLIRKKSLLKSPALTLKMKNSRMSLFLRNLFLSLKPKPRRNLPPPGSPPSRIQTKPVS